MSIVEDGWTWTLVMNVKNFYCGPWQSHKGEMKIVLQVDFDVHVQPNVLAPFIDDGYESNEVFKEFFNSTFENSVDWGKIRSHHTTYGIHKVVIGLKSVKTH